MVSSLARFVGEEEVALFVLVVCESQGWPFSLAWPGCGVALVRCRRIGRPERRGQLVPMRAGSIGRPGLPIKPGGLMLRWGSWASLGLCRERHDPPAVFPTVASEHGARKTGVPVLHLHTPGPKSLLPIMLEVTEGGQT